MRNFGRGMWRRVEYVEKTPDIKEMQYLALMEYYRLKQILDKQRRDNINNHREQILKTVNSEITLHNKQKQEIEEVPNAKEIVAVELEIPGVVESNDVDKLTNEESVLEEIKVIKTVVFEDDKLTNEDSVMEAPIIEEPVKKSKKGRRKNNK